MTANQSEMPWVEQSLQPLTAEELDSLRNNSFGKHLSYDSYYLKTFVISDKANVAADPVPFKVASRAIPRIAETIVGRPFIVGPDPSKHVRGATGTAEDIVQEQQRWAIGEFVRAIVNPLSNNVYGIVEIFKEFVDDIKKGIVRGAALPKYVSPLIEVTKTDGNGEITNGRILHVQAVDIPGYESQVAKVVGSCEGMLGECTDKLHNLGAAGVLKWYQEHMPQSAAPAVGDKQQSQLRSEEIQGAVNQAIWDAQEKKPEFFKNFRAAIANENRALANAKAKAPSISMETKIAEMKEQVEKNKQAWDRIGRFYAELNKRQAPTLGGSAKAIVGDETDHFAIQEAALKGEKILDLNIDSILKEFDDNKAVGGSGKVLTRKEEETDHFVIMEEASERAAF